ncbi:MAG: FtsX-like permease family protein [Alphaproteobacteria bacterium]|nr:FtsX-like permease family protein [Alphaproteobacteria bacterium]
MMRALDRKLWRDIWRMRLHATGVVLVLGCGLAMYIMAVGMRESLERTRADYYASNRMADLAVSLVRAPNRLEEKLAAAPGVAAVETRIMGLALLDLPQIVEPASARLVSLPRAGRPRINDLALVRGRWPDPAHGDEVLMSEAFANALDLDVGAAVEATMRGRREHLRIVGIGNSPEFVFVSAPGELFPQPERFGVIWMNREALAQAFDLDGAFNEAVFRLSGDADSERTKDALDEILLLNGSTGAYGRDRMLSDRYLVEEIKQLGTLAAFVPVFFLAVAALLVNISLGRVIATERSNIGLMKAFGYSDGAVAWHYAKSALIFAGLGAALGALVGVVFGRGVAGMYREYYHFPSLEFSASPNTFAMACLAGFGATGIGAVSSVWRSARLAPAAALAPPQPAAFHRFGDTIASFNARLDAKSRIIVRRILRFPRRTATTSIGVALAIALLVVARTFPAVMDHLLDVHFGLGNRQDVTLTFIEPREIGVLNQVERLPGVMYAEPFRAEDVIFQNGRRRVQEAIVGVPYEARLSRLIGQNGRPFEPPADGVVLSRSLATKLAAAPGDEVRVEQTRGRRIAATIRVTAIAEPMIGSYAFMEMTDLARMMREPGRISGAHVVLDTEEYEAFNRRIKETPVLAGASFVSLVERASRKNFDEHIGLMLLFYSAFAAVMAGGVAFSAARVTLAEQERDLATLRVLGFTRAEVSYVLVGELAALALMAVPIGCLIGTGLGVWLMRLFQTDMYAFPYVFNPGGYAFAIVFTLGCVLVAALVVRQDIDRLDMVGVLKSRD